MLQLSFPQCILRGKAFENGGEEILVNSVIAIDSLTRSELSLFCAKDNTDVVWIQ